MIKTFKCRYSKLLHELFEDYSKGKITKDEKIMIKSILLNNNDKYKELDLLSLSKEKKTYIKNLFNICLDDISNSTDKDSRESEISFGQSLIPIEIELSQTNNIGEKEIQNFFSSDAEI